MGHKSYTNRDFRAIKLGAMNARSLLAFSYPLIYKRLTESEIAEVQYVLDAAAVNADIERKHTELMKTAVSSRIGSQVNYDRRIVSQADGLYGTAMLTSKEDRHIRLDFKRFVSPDALIPRSNNPDEIEYLTRVKHALETYGIWLNLETYWYDTKQQSFNQDQKQFRVYLTYGRNGRSIRAPLGFVGRDEILAAASVGKGFWSEVYHGPVAQGFDKIVTRVKINLELGKDDHRRLISRNSDALPGVVAAAEFLGDADDLPNLSIWNASDDFLIKALQTRNSGDMAGAHGYLLLSLITAKENLLRLKKYEIETTKGAQKALKIAQITLVVSATILTVADAYAIYATYREVSVVTSFAREIAAKNTFSEYSGKKVAEMWRYVAAHPDSVVWERVTNLGTKGLSKFKPMSGL